ncbi:MAG: hypothetical protein QGI24_00590 [Kiritimatiellia bacterium]|jgi:hypothetical protein|nr:hypothetical protein [Kiritimatiellia bacterium]
MKRRTLIQTTAAALAAHGCLPLLAAEKKSRKAPTKRGWGNSRNPYTKPCAIEPITGVLPTFSPATGPAMSGAFAAQYSLLAWEMAAEKSKNKPMGFMKVNFKGGTCQTVEKRDGKGSSPSCTIKTSVQFAGKKNATTTWTLESLVDGRDHVRFIEEGIWNGKRMTVKAKSFSRQYATANPLIHRWALLPLLASGRIKKAALMFDMLDDSALRANQTLRYEGEIDIPVKSGTASVDSYVQTGYGIVPTHYLVDKKGRVQLITMATVNWVLTGRSG